MINGKTVLGIIPARGGSKGIPRKNIKLICGKPLISWTIVEAMKSMYLDRLILSSDDDEIINVAREWGCEAPFKRPDVLAKDDTPGTETVIHAINTLPEKYDFICLLQPTSPLRKVTHIDGAIEKCITNNAESCVSVTKADKHPYWMYEICDEGFLKPLIESEFIYNRQELSSLYVLNGAIYIIKAEQIIKSKTFINENTLGFIMDKKYSTDIDEQLDFETAEYYLGKGI